MEDAGILINKTLISFLWETRDQVVILGTSSIIS